MGRPILLVYRTPLPEEEEEFVEGLKLPFYGLDREICKYIEVSNLYRAIEKIGTRTYGGLSKHRGLILADSMIPSRKGETDHSLLNAIKILQVCEMVDMPSIFLYNGEPSEIKTQAQGLASRFVSRYPNFDKKEYSQAVRELFVESRI